MMTIRFCGHILANRAQEAITISECAQGLLGKSHLPSDEALILHVTIPFYLKLAAVAGCMFGIGIAPFAPVTSCTLLIGSALLVFLSKAIHTIGMRFAIDLLFLDQENRVVKRRDNVQPGRVILPPWMKIFRVAKVVELPGGKLVPTRITIGDQIELSLVTEG